jgi:E3 ubiquitin-protein ligase TRIP12
VFATPDAASTELVENGRDIAVTLDNLGLYIELMLEYYLGSGSRPAFAALVAGWDAVCYTPMLATSLYASELGSILCGDRSCHMFDFSEASLRRFVRLRGYSAESTAVRLCFKIMSEFSASEQHSFLKFVTGSTMLPSGGLKALSPALTIVKMEPISGSFSRERSESGASSQRQSQGSNSQPHTTQSRHALPTAMTCQHLLKLPEFSDEDELRQKLVMSCRESRSFELS